MLITHGLLYDQLPSGRFHGHCTSYGPLQTRLRTEYSSATARCTKCTVLQPGRSTKDGWCGSHLKNTFSFGFLQPSTAHIELHGCSFAALFLLREPTERVQ
uniref:(northern house mosquito) hypothetical protein n=1 Tax=Culex pipiens TaxID=7175 RepID=A0A8D8B6A8_CULPI